MTENKHAQVGAASATWDEARATIAAGRKNIVKRLKMRVMRLSASEGVMRVVCNAIDQPGSSGKTKEGIQKREVVANEGRLPGPLREGVVEGRGGEDLSVPIQPEFIFPSASPPAAIAGSLGSQSLRLACE